MIGVSVMQESEQDRETFVQVSWLWTPIALLTTVLLMVGAVLAIPLVFVVTQLSLPRTIKPLPDV